MSTRHAACKVPGKNVPVKSLPVKISVTIRPRIIVRIELKKNMAVESTARHELKICVEELKMEHVEIKKYLTEEAKELRLQSRGGGTHKLHVFMKMLPCTSLIELDSLRDCIEIRTNFLQCVR